MPDSRGVTKRAAVALVICTLALVSPPAQGAIILWGILPPAAPHDAIVGLIDIETGVELIQTRTDDPSVLNTLGLNPPSNRRGLGNAGGGLVNPPTGLTSIDADPMRLFEMTDRGPAAAQRAKGLRPITAIDLRGESLAVVDWGHSLVNGSLWTVGSFGTFSLSGGLFGAGDSGRNDESYLSLFNVRFSGAGGDLVFGSGSDKTGATTLGTMGLKVASGAGGDYDRNGDSSDDLGPLYIPGVGAKLPGWIAWLFEMPPLVAFAVVTSLLLAVIKIASWMMPVAVE